MLGKGRQRKVIMPKQTRWAIKRDLDYAAGDIERAEAQIAKTGERFKGVHDDLHDACVAIFSALEVVLIAVRSLRDQI